MLDQALFAPVVLGIYVGVATVADGADAAYAQFRLREDWIHPVGKMTYFSRTYLRSYLPVVGRAANLTRVKDHPTDAGKMWTIWVGGGALSYLYAPAAWQPAIACAQARWPLPQCGAYEICP